MKWRVTGSFTIDYAIEVEAESEERARQIAQDDIDLDELLENEVGFDNSVEDCEPI